MKNAKRLISALLLSVLCLSTAGCGAVIVGGAAAAGTYFYLDGQTRGTYNVSLNKAYKASLAACEDLQIPVISQSKDGADAKVVGKYYGDEVTISLQLVGDNLTEITVRVGLFGNESASRRINNAINEKL